jgi:CRISPR-associated exonuclease Cas4
MKPMTAPSESADDDLLPISVLNALLFCERRCAMQMIEHVWRDNAFTLEGAIGHRRAHQAYERTEPNLCTVHGVWLRSYRLRLIGKADVVEFREGKEERTMENEQPSGASLPAGPLAPRSPLSVVHSSLFISPASTAPYPVEYKRGRRRRWDNDDVQLCAQALCLEEMLGVAVPAGAIFHIKSRRRREVVFTAELRAKTEHAARRLHELVARGVTPPPVLKPRCRGCSLRELCLPELLPDQARLREYQRELYRE